ncbi:TPA: DUF977 family protein [Klebsiella pneumoniae]|nr:DUF977 family protein [Klebsiella pneumoniae]HBY8547563.1 DUF977 family protein [Klebsiella pneumoniae]HBY8828277.1 DUF977 family protein [Klebsiella pneumoniae]HBY9115932.1 DUF977 family protein [Klebsiella pneumoniae]HBY9597501.1 DUF977 family protein [Klebsiella pneumoniae]
MGNITWEKRDSFIKQIIDETRLRGRLTVRDACQMLGMNRDAVQRYFKIAENSGEVYRHGNLGLFPDYRATIKFDLQRYTCKKAAKDNSQGQKLNSTYDCLRRTHEVPAA